MYRLAVVLFVSIHSGCGLLLDADLQQEGGGADGGTDARRDVNSADTGPGDAPAVDVSSPDTIVPPAVGCGGPTALVDDFEDGVTSDRWRVGGMAFETGGVLELRTSAGGFAQYYSSVSYDIDEDWVAMRVTRGPPGASIYLSIIDPDDNGATISIDDGRGLSMRGFDSPSFDASYDPMQPLWLSIGEAGGQIRFRTSSDGVVWTDYPPIPAPSPLRPVRFEIGLYNYGTSGAAAQVDDFNLDPGHPSEPHCPAEVVDMSQRPRFWVGNAYSAVPDPGCASTLPDGSLQLTLPHPSAGTSTSCEYLTSEAFDLDGQWLTVHFGSRTLAPSISAYLFLFDTRWQKVAAFAGDDWGWFNADGSTPDMSFNPILSSGELASHMRLGAFSGELVLEIGDGTSWEPEVRVPVSRSVFDTSAVRLGVGIDTEPSATVANEANVLSFRGVRP